MREALTYAFGDGRWLPKLAVLTLAGCIPGLNIMAWVGYQQSIAHNIARGLANPLPSWDDWADILVRGLISASASILYLLPAGIFWLIGWWPPVHGIALLIAFLWVVIGGCALYAGYVRYARTDQSSEYGVDGWLNWLRTSRRFRWTPLSLGFACQIGLLVIGLAATPFVLLTLIGLPVLWTAISVINGNLIGQVAARQRSV